MKYIKINYWIVLLVTTLLSGCTPSAVTKEDIRPDSTTTREEVIELQKLDPMDSSGLSLIEPKNDGSTRTIVEIQGNQKGVKFTDDSWQDYPIWLNLNVVPIRTFFVLLEELTGLNFVVGDEVTGDLTLKLNNVNFLNFYLLLEKILI